MAAAGLIHALRLHRGALEDGAARGGELHGELGRALDREAVAFDRADQVIRLDAGHHIAGHHIAGHHIAGHHMARSTPPESQGGGIT
jgi:hypothetical protein